MLAKIVPAAAALVAFAASPAAAVEWKTAGSGSSLAAIAPPAVSALEAAGFIAFALVLTTALTTLLSRYG